MSVKGRCSSFCVTKMASSLLTFFVVFIILLSSSSSSSSVESKIKTVLISIDAFGWNLLDSLNVSTPNINKLIETGVFAKYGIRNEFPPVTLTNHVALATGRHTDEHGMVFNKMFDPELNETFRSWQGSKSVDETNFEKSTRWVNNSAEPIWVTIKRQGAGKSISIMWPLSNFDYKGYQIDKWVGFDSKVEYRKRIDDLVEYVKEEDYSLGMVYMEQLDNTIHKLGLETQELKDAMVMMDGVIGYLLEKLEQEGLWPCCINIILTSDHGMAQSQGSKYIRVRDYSTGFSTSYGSMRPAKGREEEVWSKMGSAPHMRLYRKYDPVPVSLHFSNHRRIFDFVPLLDEGYYLTWEENVTNIDVGRVVGRHDYDTRYSSMWPTFIASGPAFKESVNVKPFNISQVYCLICYIHQVNPHPDTHCLEEETNDVIEQTMKETSFKFTITTSSKSETTTTSIEIPNVATTTGNAIETNSAISIGEFVKFHFITNAILYKLVGTI